jgi:hypothetical protein
VVDNTKVRPVVMVASSAGDGGVVVVHPSTVVARIAAANSVGATPREFMGVLGLSGSSLPRLISKTHAEWNA